jgi:hypothetical protein
LKTIRISDAAHRELTRLLGEMMAKTGKPQTYNDVINALTAHSVIIPANLLEKIDATINENKQLGFTTKEEFIRDAIRFRLRWLKGEYQFIEISKEHYEQLDEAVKEMSAP